MVREALAQLPPEYREIIILKHFQEWPYEQIANSTGDTVGTLKVRAHRARRLLKERLAELGWVTGSSASGRPKPTGRFAGDKETNDG